MSSDNEKNNKGDEEPAQLSFSNITEHEKNLLDRSNYIGSSDEEDEDEDHAETHMQPVEKPMTTEAREKLLANIDDPLNRRLSSK